MAHYYEYDLDKLAKIRKVTERDRRVIKEEPSEFLNSVNLIDMDILFPKMTKEEFIKVWNSLWDKSVYFVDRLEIENHKVRLLPCTCVWNKLVLNQLRDGAMKRGFGNEASF